MSKHVTVLFGTRPEAIKLAPVILKLRDQNRNMTVIHTEQHAELAEPILDRFGIEPDHRLKMMRDGQQPLDLLSRLLAKLPHFITPTQTDILLVQGDTTSALAGALTAHHQKVKLAHLEAGLRSHDKSQPFPEESNRMLISHLSDIHFAPTAAARQNLLAERIDPDSIHVTGNSVVDALQMIIESSTTSTDQIREKYVKPNGKLLLLTTHRRENFGKPLQGIFGAVKQLALQHPDLSILLPSHPNPNVLDMISELEGVSNINVIDPLPYEEFVALMAAADLILTDSGGIQEEAPALGTPVFVLREKTERPELQESGAGKLIGTKKASIIEAVNHFLKSPQNRESKEIFGDGHTAERVAGLI